MLVLGLDTQGAMQCCEAPQKVTLGQARPGRCDPQVRTVFMAEAEFEFKKWCFFNRKIKQNKQTKYTPASQSN